MTMTTVRRHPNESPRCDEKSDRSTPRSTTTIASVAEEMNPSRRNTMEDAHAVHFPGTWDAPDPDAAFVGVYDGHGGRSIADYLEDNLAANVAAEWAHAAEERKASGDESGERGRRRSKRRRTGREGDDRPEGDGGERDNDVEDGNDDGAPPSAVEREGELLRRALERAFLLTDVQSRMDGIATSGATVACCVVVPKFAPDGAVASVWIHAANAGDARAVLSSITARPSRGWSREADASVGEGGAKEEEVQEKEGGDGARSAASSGPCFRLTHDHKSTDPAEVARIEAAGGILVRGRVLGVLAVARSLGDHGLKEYVVGKPYVSSTEVRVSVCRDGNLGGSRGRGAVPPFTDGEFLIVACDGLWDVMKDQEAVDFVRGHVNNNRKEGRETAAASLVEEALRRESTDNVTVIVYWL
ncbi:hypothetical protein ACHAWF_018334 [Thalassiosira exigua]